MPTPTYDLIEEKVLGSAQASVTFSSIPGTYKDLVLEIVGASSSATSQRVVARVNSDSGNNYSETRLIGNGSTATSSRNSNFSQTYTGLYIGATANTTLSTLIGNFQSYANTNVNKTILWRASAAGSEVTAVVSLWRSTSAITAIEMFWDSGASWATGSTFRLWGVAG